MASAELLAVIDAGREEWNGFQKRRTASQLFGGDRPKLDLSSANLAERDLSGWIFENVDLSKAILTGSILKGAYFSGVNLSEAHLQRVDLSQAHLQLVDLAESDLTDATLKGLFGSVWVSFINATLVRADLSNISLMNARFDSADLSESTLVRASLEGAILSEASLRDADLRRSNLSGANLEGADLRGAKFDAANLHNASIYRTIPMEPDLSGALNIPSSVPKRYAGFAYSPGGGGGGHYYDPPDAESVAVRIRVFYATDRLSGSGRRIYGTKQGTELSFGSAEVSVPKFKRQIGEVPRPRLWKLEFRENLARHMVILGVDEMDDNAFYSEFIASGQASHSSPAILLFIHGYNVSFEAAVRRVAQLAYDLNFQGTPLLYSWASQATLRGYPVDLANNEKTWPRLANLMCRLREQAPPPAVHLIAHSMGGRAACHALTLSSIKCPTTHIRFENIIFAAPDVHATSFRDTLPKLVESSQRLTLYFCPDDVPLRLSRTFHDTPRAGEMALIARGLDTIDASAVSSDLLHHSVFGERSVLPSVPT